MTTSKRGEMTEYLRDLVGQKEVGDLLPTIAELCDLYGVSGPQTVRNSYAPLIAEGLVVVVQSPQRRFVVAAHTRTTPVSLDDVEADLDDAQAAITQARSKLAEIRRAA